MKNDRDRDVWWLPAALVALAGLLFLAWSALGQTNWTPTGYHFAWSDDPANGIGWEPAVNGTKAAWWPITGVTPVPSPSWPPGITPGHQVWEQVLPFNAMGSGPTPTPGAALSIRAFNGTSFSAWSNVVLGAGPTHTPTWVNTYTPTLTQTPTPSITYTPTQPPTATPSIPPTVPPTPKAPILLTCTCVEATPA